MEVVIGWIIAIAPLAGILVSAGSVWFSYKATEHAKEVVSLMSEARLREAEFEKKVAFWNIACAAVGSEKDHLRHKMIKSICVERFGKEIFEKSKKNKQDQIRIDAVGLVRVVGDDLGV